MSTDDVRRFGLGHCAVCHYAPIFIDGELANAPEGWVIVPSPIEDGLPIATGHSRGCPDLPPGSLLSPPTTLAKWGP